MRYENSFRKLYDAARGVISCRKLSEVADCGGVGSALLTKSGNIFTGICFDCTSGIGFCAEHAAVAEMLKNKESEIQAIVSVDWDGKVLPPCGRCRELLQQVNRKNLQTAVFVSKTKAVKLKELLPHRYKYEKP